MGWLPHCRVPVRAGLVVGSVSALGSVCVAFRLFSDLLLDKGVLQSLVDADAFGWVQHQGAIQQVLQLHHLLPLVLRQSLASDHVCQQVFGGVDGAHHRHLLLMMQRNDTSQAELMMTG